MITEAMRQAGWRGCPSDKVRRAWEEKGGRWQIALDPHQRADVEIVPVVLRPCDPMPSLPLVRPVHFERGWDYAPDGWGDVVSSPSNNRLPTEPGWYWWRNTIHSGTCQWQPVETWVHHADGLMCTLPSEAWLAVTETGGEWGGPCLGKPG